MIQPTMGRELISITEGFIILIYFVVPSEFVSTEELLSHCLQQSLLTNNQYVTNIIIIPVYAI